MLLLSAGRRVSLLRGFQAAFADRSGSVFGADVNPELSAACHVADAAFGLPYVSEPEFVEELVDLCERQNVNLIVPTIDTELEVLARHRSQFLESDVHIVVSDEPFIKICGDKRETASFFLDNDLATPALFRPDGITYPAIAKPFDGSLSADISVLREPRDLTPAILSNPRIIYTEYIDHDRFAEFTCDLYYSRDNELRCVVPRERLAVRGGEVAKARTAKHEIVDLLFDNLGVIEGARGCVTLQLFRNAESGETSCIEINARFGGGFPLARHAGADYQEWIVREYLDDRPIEAFHDWTEGLTMLRYDDEIIV